MADSYWRYGDARQQPAALPPHMAKRPRSDYEMPSGHDISSYYAREDERGGQRVIIDTDSINASYDHYLRSAQISYGGETRRSMSGGFQLIDDPHVLAMRGSDPVVAAKGRSMGLGGRSEIPFPPDASSTLFVEGLPANCTRREVSHIFHPFVCYKEVRLVNKESRHSGGDPPVLCFVDFQSPAHAATVMDAIQDIGLSGGNVTITFYLVVWMLGQLLLQFLCSLLCNQDIGIDWWGNNLDGCPLVSCPTARGVSAEGCPAIQ